MPAAASAGRYPLPDRADPGYDRAAALGRSCAGADQGDTAGAEAATGYYWGDPALFPQVERILAEAREDRDDRLEQLAERFLRGPRAAAHLVWRHHAGRARRQAGRGPRRGAQPAPRGAAGPGPRAQPRRAGPARACCCSGTRPTTSWPSSGRRWTASNRWWRPGAATPSPTRPTRPSPTIPRSSCPSGRPASRWRRTCGGSGTRRKPYAVRAGRGRHQGRGVILRRMPPRPQLRRRSRAPPVGKHVHHLARAQPALHPLPELHVQQVAVRLEEGVPQRRPAAPGRRGTPPGTRPAPPRRTTARRRTPPRSMVGGGIRRKRQSESRQSSS